MAALEADRERHQKRASLIDQRDQATAETGRLQSSATSALATIQSNAPQARSLREADPISEIDAAIEHANAIDAEATDTLIRELEALAKEQTAVAEIDAKLMRFRALVIDIEEKQAILLAKGDVVDAEATATEQRDDAVRTIAAHQASVEAHNKTLADYRRFAARDHVPGPDTICQMCGRPISPDDLDHTRRHAEQRIAEIDGQIILLRDEMARQEARVSAIDMDLSQIKVRAKDLDVLRERIANGQSKIADAETEWTAAREVQGSRMSRLSRTEPVAEDEIRSLAERLACERAIEKARVSLGQIRESLARAMERVQTFSAQIDEIGDVSFDPATLTQARHGSRRRPLGSAAAHLHRPATRAAT